MKRHLQSSEYDNDVTERSGDKLQFSDKIDIPVECFTEELIRF